MTEIKLPVQDDDLRRRVMRAIFDPGATEGFKGDRDLTTWQTDAVMRILSALVAAPAPVTDEAVAWVVPGSDNARSDGFLDAMAWQEGEFTRPLYAAPQPAPSAATEIAKLRARCETLQADLDAGREYMRTAWHEMNAIRASIGSPSGVSEEYWSDTVDALERLLGDEAKPWMNGAATELYKAANKSTVKAQDRATRAEAMCAELAGALEPFAAIAENDIGDDETDTDLFRPMSNHNRSPRLRVGDLRGALDVLARYREATPSTDGEAR